MAETTVVIINPDTDGAVIVTCRLRMAGNKLQVIHDKKRGWVMELDIRDILAALGDDGHG